MDQRRESERWLRRAVLRGDAAAWNALYDSHFRALYRFCFFRCGRDEAGTEEAVQESWMVAVKTIRRFDPELGSFQSWLTGIARHVLRNQERRRMRQAREQADPALDSRAEAGSRADERAESVGLALTELPLRYQEVLQARYHEERSVAEIAARARLSLKATESLLSRARAALREALHRRHLRDPRTG